MITDTILKCFVALRIAYQCVNLIDILTDIMFFGGACAVLRKLSRAIVDILVSVQIQINWHMQILVTDIQVVWSEYSKRENSSLFITISKCKKVPYSSYYKTLLNIRRTLKKFLELKIQKLAKNLNISGTKNN